MPCKQLGVILDNMLPSQANFYVQKNGIKAIDKKIIDDLTIFYIEKTSLMNQPRFSVCHISQLSGFSGDVIATSIPSFIKLLKTPIIGQKIYYMYNMEWLLGGVVDSNQLFKLYRQEKVIYVARNEEHKKLLVNNFNRVPDIIMENFDFKALYGG